MRQLPAIATTLVLLFCTSDARAESHWFEEFKQSASAEQMYRFLYALPKGGDLHNHLSGSNFSDWWYDLAVDEERNGGYRYYTKTRINNCAEYGGNMFGFAPYLLLFRNLQESNYQTLTDCEKSEYKPLAELNTREKNGWLNSIVLDKGHEGRDEFFQTHWQRLNDLAGNPTIMAELLVMNMQAFGREGLVYLETQVGSAGYLKPSGKFYAPDDVANIFRTRLQQRDAQATGVTVRLQHALLRFAPNAEQELERIYQFVHDHNDLYVAINMVGREDNDKGYPLRFLPTLRKLRQTIPGVQLAIHAGEVDEPNRHVRDTLLLGAKRIGHGVNLISDPETMLLMRHSDYLVEINLVSNLLLEYVDNYSQHPFPEYLRFGIPVALSTDDRGMWDSNITDEYFVAVTEFNLSWDEVVQLGRNSLQYSFTDPETKAQLLKDYDKRVTRFAKQFRNNPEKVLQSDLPRSHGFSCQRYQICL